METLWVSLRLNNCKEIYVCSVYWPPKGDPDKFIDILFADVEQFLSVDRKFL